MKTLMETLLKSLTAKLTCKTSMRLGLCRFCDVGCTPDPRMKGNGYEMKRLATIAILSLLCGCESVYRLQQNVDRNERTLTTVINCNNYNADRICELERDVAALKRFVEWKKRNNKK